MSLLHVFNNSIIYLPISIYSKMTIYAPCVHYVMPKRKKSVDLCLVFLFVFFFLNFKRVMSKTLFYLLLSISSSLKICSFYFLLYFLEIWRVLHTLTFTLYNSLLYRIQSPHIIGYYLGITNIHRLYTCIVYVLRVYWFNIKRIFFA